MRASQPHAESSNFFFRFFILFFSVGWRGLQKRRRRRRGCWGKWPRLVFPWQLAPQGQA
jgi:hypothetical protein